MAKTIKVPALDHDAKMLKEFGHKVTPNGRLERRIIAALIAHLKRNGFSVVGVWDGEEFTKASNAKEAMEAIFNLDEASLRVITEGFNREEHEKTRNFKSRNAFADNEHGILLVLGNGVDIISDWNYFKDDRDGFNAAMDAFDAEEFA